jgi:hypothetical protein
VKLPRTAMLHGMAGSDGHIDTTPILDWSFWTKQDGMWVRIGRDRDVEGGAGAWHGGVIACGTTGVCSGVMARACRSKQQQAGAQQAAHTNLKRTVHLCAPPQAVAWPQNKCCTPQRQSLLWANRLGGHTTQCRSQAIAPPMHVHQA